MTYNLLIVEDNASKRVEIERALPADMVFDVQWTPSIAQAYRAISGRRWDLVILDMTFQASQAPGHESAKESLAGVELLQFMAHGGIDVPVIVATQHSVFSSPEMPELDSVAKLDSMLAVAFPNNYRETVEVDLSGETWKARLRAAIACILGGKNEVAAGR